MKNCAKFPPQLDLASVSAEASGRKQAGARGNQTVFAHRFPWKKLSLRSSINWIHASVLDFCRPGMLLRQRCWIFSTMGGVTNRKEKFRDRELCISFKALVFSLNRNRNTFSLSQFIPVFHWSSLASCIKKCLWAYVDDVMYASKKPKALFL